jgi:DNA polymerase-1
MRLLLHNEPHDVPIIAEMFGCTAEQLLRRWRELDITVDDTMMKSFVLRLTPQGLKSLGLRFCGKYQPSYPEVVREADREKAVAYLYKLLENVCTHCEGVGSIIVQPEHKSSGKLLDPRPVTCSYCEGDGTAWPPPDTVLAWNPKTRQPYFSRGHRIGSRIRGIINDLDKVDPQTGRKTNPRQRWEKVDEDFRLKVEDVAGPMPEVSLNDVQPQSVAVEYSAADADITLRVDRVLDNMLDADPGHRVPNSLRNIYDINMGCRPLLIHMMEVGTYVDKPRLAALDEQLENAADILLYQLEREVGHYVNPRSPKQVAEVLFDELGLPVIAETDGGDASTADKVLEDLKLYVAALPDSPKNSRDLRIVTRISDHREITTARSRYTIEMPRKCDAGSRIHTTFKDTRTGTNRLSSADPNLQNIINPEKVRAHTGQTGCECMGCGIRGAFSVEPGWSMISLDYSQIEVRVLAHESGDPILIDAITRGLDVHLVTASRIFRIPMAKVSKQQRAISKNITFLILYGGGAPRLRAELKLKGINVTLEAAQELIDAYFDAYPGIARYMRKRIAEAKEFGYVEDMFGWRRYLPGVHSDISGVRSEAERQAVNSPIQSGAAGIMKQAMPEIFWEVLPAVRKKGWWADALLTVHDEFVLQVKKGGEKMLIERCSEAMTRLVKLAVPVTVDGKAGDRWSTCH